MTRSLPLVLLFLALVAAPAAGQDEPPGRPGVIMLVPYGGANVPVKVLLTDHERDGGYDTDLGYVLGLRLQVPVRGRLEARGDVGYAASKFHGYGAFYEQDRGTAHFVGITARMAYRFTPRRSRVSVAATAGGGWMRHWISSPQPDYHNWPAAVAGMEVGLPVSQGMRVIFGAESFVYKAAFGGQFPVSATQFDLRFTVGLAGR